MDCSWFINKYAKEICPAKIPGNIAYIKNHHWFDKLAKFSSQT